MSNSIFLENLYQIKFFFKVIFFNFLHTKNSEMLCFFVKVGYKSAIISKLSNYD